MLRKFLVYSSGLAGSRRSPLPKTAPSHTQLLAANLNQKLEYRTPAVRTSRYPHTLSRIRTQKSRGLKLSPP